MKNRALWALCGVLLLSGLSLWISRSRPPDLGAAAPAMANPSEAPTVVTENGEAAADSAQAAAQGPLAQLPSAASTAAAAVREQNAAANAAREQQRALARAYAADSAEKALKALLVVSDSDATRTIERGLEDLCFERTDREQRRRGAQTDERRAQSWRFASEARRKEYCRSMQPMQGDESAYDAALAAHGPDSFTEAGKTLRESTAKPLKIRSAEAMLARSRDFGAMLAAAVFLDEEAALGVPPFSHDAQRPASLAPIIAGALGWVVCTELQACGPQSGNTIALCRYSNDCPPDADYASALRMMNSATRFEQIQWLYQRVLAMRQSF